MHYPTLPQIYTNHRAKVHKKSNLPTPSLRFPLQAGGTNPRAVPLAKRGEPTEGGNCER
jgi:hypothetical protein